MYENQKDLFIIPVISEIKIVCIIIVIPIDSGCFMIRNDVFSIIFNIIIIFIQRVVY